MSNRKKYRACACKGPGFCPRYKKMMSQAHWSLCKVSEKHRMLFDEMAGNFIFGMIHFKNENIREEAVEAIKFLEKEKIEKRSKKKMDVNAANKAINELKNEGIDLTQLGINKEEGLGDTVERVLTKFGLTKDLMTKIAGKSCGCSERKKWLNKLLPYAKNDLPAEDVK